MQGMPMIVKVITKDNDTYILQFQVLMDKDVVLWHDSCYSDKHLVVVKE